MTEMDLMKELLAYSITEWDKNEDYNKKRFSRFPPPPGLNHCPIPPNFENTTRTILKQLYVPRSAQYVADVFGDSGVLPDSGIVSISAAKAIVEKSATGYFEDVVDSGVDACMVLNGNLPEEKVERIFMTCGPSKEEVLSENGYVRPAKELELWSKHYREVLATAESVQR